MNIHNIDQHSLFSQHWLICDQIFFTMRDADSGETVLYQFDPTTMKATSVIHSNINIWRVRFLSEYSPSDKHYQIVYSTGGLFTINRHIGVVSKNQRPPIPYLYDVYLVERIIRIVPRLSDFYKVPNMQKIIRTLILLVQCLMLHPDVKNFILTLVIKLCYENFDDYAINKFVTSQQFIE